MDIVNGISGVSRLAAPTPGELRQIAHLHVGSLPDSQISTLGEDFAVSFYRYVCRSPHETIIVYARDGKIMAGAVVSFKTESLKRRLLRHTQLFYAVLAAFVMNSGFRKSLLSGLRKPVPKPQADRAELPTIWPASPELILLFVESALRGQGVGGELLAACERDAAERGCAFLRVKTLLAEDNLALQFYDSHGYRRVGIARESGKSYAAFMKSLKADEQVAL